MKRLIVIPCLEFKNPANQTADGDQLIQPVTISCPPSLTGFHKLIKNNSAVLDAAWRTPHQTQVLRQVRIV